MAAIQIERVTKVYDGKVTAVDDVSLRSSDGEFMVLVGPSGCGKSTLLRVIAGLEQVTSGRVLIGDDDVTALDPADRDVAMVFQSYALYPHKTVRENLAFGLRRRRPWRRTRSGARVDAMAEMLGLGELLDRKPAALSGGQRQRVAMGRALVREPRAFLMDEPLSNLDAKLRTSMRGELARLHERLADDDHLRDPRPGRGDDARPAGRGDEGRAGSSSATSRSALFDEPANLFVGAFIGSPAMNLVEATVAGGRVRFGQQEILLEGAAAASRARWSWASGRRASRCPSRTWRRLAPDDGGGRHRRGARRRAQRAVRGRRARRDDRGRPRRDRRRRRGRRGPPARRRPPRPLHGSHPRAAANRRGRHDRARDRPVPAAPLRARGRRERWSGEPV